MLVWIVVAVLAAVGETLTFDLFLASVSVAAVIAALLALIAVPILFQFAAFAVLSLAGIFYFRPLVKRALGIDSNRLLPEHLPRAELMGKQAVVTRQVSARGGQIRVGEGEFWSARSYDPEEVIPEGARAEIMVVDGLTALVEPVREIAPAIAPEEQGKEPRHVGR